MKLLLAIIMTVATAFAGDHPDNGFYNGVSHGGTYVSMAVSGIGADFTFSGQTPIDLLWDHEEGFYVSSNGSYMFEFWDYSTPEMTIWIWVQYWDAGVQNWVEINWGQMAHS